LITFAVSVLQGSLAFAQAAPGQQAPAWMSMLPMVMVFGVMYFFMIRPQMRKQKMHQEFLTKLKRGDEVLTTGGMLGRIEGLTDVFATVEIAPGVRVKVLRSQIASFVPTANTQNSEVKA
jgi:preprotein translocase subunit YajC